MTSPGRRAEPPRVSRMIGCGCRSGLDRSRGRLAMGHRGRPRKPNARSRATTRAGRQAPPDLGTKEIRHLKQILTPRQPGLPADPLAALYSRELISEASYVGW